nr:GntR family transcriptional regulator [Micromonospora yangpuensis]
MLTARSAGTARIPPRSSPADRTWAKSLSAVGYEGGGLLPPGAKLPSRRELIDQYGVTEPMIDRAMQVSRIKGMTGGVPCHQRLRCSYFQRY